MRQRLHPLPSGLDERPPWGVVSGLKRSLCTFNVCYNCLALPTDKLSYSLQSTVQNHKKVPQNATSPARTALSSPLEECEIGSFARLPGSSCSLCPDGADCRSTGAVRRFGSVGAQGTATPGSLPGYYRHRRASVMPTSIT